MNCAFFFFLIYLFIYLFLAVLGLRFCARAFSSCGERGPLFIAVRGPLTVAASLGVEHRLQTRRLSSCGARAQLLRGMWDPPRPGLEPVSPALAGRFSTTAPPGKPNCAFLRPDRRKCRKDSVTIAMANQWGWQCGHSCTVSCDGGWQLYLGKVKFVHKVQLGNNVIDLPWQREASGWLILPVAQLVPSEYSQGLWFIATYGPHPAWLLGCVAQSVASCFTWQSENSASWQRFAYFYCKQLDSGHFIKLVTQTVW